MRPRRILHVLTQRPGQTGSGVTLDTMVAHAAAAGFDQRIVVGVPADDVPISIGGLGSSHILPVLFEHAELSFPVPGMSDVMPYRSTVWSRMDAAMLDRYRRAWRRHLGAVIDSYQPDLIHAHHVWIVSSMLRDVAASTPIVVQCHGTGLRQMELCPHLAEEVSEGCAGADHFQVLREDHVAALRAALGVDRERVSIVPAGFREELFHARGRGRGRGEARRLLYVGKYSAAKGVPQLLDAMDALVARAGWGDAHLDVAGSGSGTEADGLRSRMEAMPCVTLHGQLDQAELAALMRACDVCVLPSFYEGVPLVLVEAAACGCRLVATALPGVVGALAPALGDRLELVEAPPMAGVDTPHADCVADFTHRLGVAIERALSVRAGPSTDSSAGQNLATFGWGAVFERVRAIWGGLLPASAPD